MPRVEHDRPRFVAGLVHRLRRFVKAALDVGGLDMNAGQPSRQQFKRPIAYFDSGRSDDKQPLPEAAVRLNRIDVQFIPGRPPGRYVDLRKSGESESELKKFRNDAWERPIYRDKCQKPGQRDEQAAVSGYVTSEFRGEHRVRSRIKLGYEQSEGKSCPP
ncbi:protein of unknown function [Methylocaldum szegediense]|uniref:Uncharacterized protein n=1 Tax=Methylocaldum szegediense TaxID=73780 RepID=A0ABN8X2Q7_9GAMM|nr:protein of unknown function [Methylocaldum szegediense]